MEKRTSTSLRRSLFEVTVLAGVFFVDQWVLRGLSNPLFEIPALGVVVWVFVISIRRRGGFERHLPHAAGKPRRAWLETFAATAIPAVVLLAWGVSIRGPYDEIPLKIAQASVLGLLVWVSQHLVWASLQQVLLQLFLRPVIGEILKKPAIATAATAMLFGLLHLPCLVLAVSTTILGAMWMILFSRHRRIVPLIVSHATLAALAFVIVPPQWSCELNVGVAAQRKQPKYRVLRLSETREILETVTSDDYFKSKGGTNQDFIKSLYRDMLRRTPADAEVQHWLDRMNEDMSRNRVAVAFAGTQEFRKRSLKQQEDITKGNR